MPSSAPPITHLLDALSPEAAEGTAPASSNEVKKALLDMASDLLATQAKSSIFATPNTTPDPYRPSLQTLYARLETGALAPSPLKALAKEASRVKDGVGKKTGKPPLRRPLEDFEDVYYAMLAMVQDMHQTLSTRLSSGFNAPSDPLFENGITIASFHAWLLEQWEILNDARLAKALDNAIRRSRVKHLHQELIAQVELGALTEADADELLADLYDPNEYETVAGLAWLGAWSPAMISAWLEEKYRIILKLEKEAAIKKERLERKRAYIQKAAAKKREERRVETERLESESQSLFGMKIDGGKTVIVEKQATSPRGKKQEYTSSEGDVDILDSRVQYGQWLQSMAKENVKKTMECTMGNVQHYATGGQGQQEGAEDLDTEMGDAEG